MFYLVGTISRVGNKAQETQQEALFAILNRKLSQCQERAQCSISFVPRLMREKVASYVQKIKVSKSSPLGSRLVEVSIGSPPPLNDTREGRRVFVPYYAKVPSATRGIFMHREIPARTWPRVSRTAAVFRERSKFRGNYSRVSSEREERSIRESIEGLGTSSQRRRRLYIRYIISQLGRELRRKIQVRSGTPPGEKFGAGLLWLKYKSLVGEPRGPVPVFPSCDYVISFGPPERLFFRLTIFHSYLNLANSSRIFSFL